MASGTRVNLKPQTFKAMGLLFALSMRLEPCALSRVPYIELETQAIPGINHIQD